MNDDTRTQTQSPGGQAPTSPSLSRRTDDRLLAGVASGVADYLRVDPIVIRIVLILLTIFGGGLGILLYIVGWIAIPARGEDTTAAERALAPHEAQGRGRRILGMLLLAVGIIIVANIGGPGGGPPFLWWGGGPFGVLTPGLVWAALLITVGVLLYRQGDQRLRTTSANLPQAPQVPPAPGASSTTAATTGVPSAPHARDAGPQPTHGAPSGGSSQTATAHGPAGPASLGSTVGSTPGGPGTPHAGGPGTPHAGGPGTPHAGGPAGPHAGGTPGSVPASPPPPEEPSSPLGRLTLAAALVAVGIGALLDQVGVLALSVADLVAVALVVVAGGLVVGAFVGRARWLIAVAFALLPVLAVAAVVDSAPRLVGGPIITEEGGAGERLYTPMDIEEVRSSYSLGTGRLELDLSQVEVPAGETLDIEVQVTAGEIDVRLPANTTAELDGQALVGEVRLLERRSAGVRVVTSESAAGDADAGEVRMDLRVAAGSIGVHQAVPPPDEDDDANEPGDRGDDPASGGDDPLDGQDEPTADGSATRGVALVGALPGELALRVNVPWMPATTTQNWEDR